jgi:hypothetical protein
MKLIRAALAALVVALAPGFALAQTVVAACGTAPGTYDVGRPAPATIDVNGRACVAASISGGGDASAANQTTMITKLTSIDGKLPSTLGQKAMAASIAVTLASDQGAVPVSGTFWQATQPVSLVSLPALATGSNVIGAVTQSGTWNVTNISGTVSLPTGAATAAKQPALGTAGTPSADVITVQGTTSMTPLLGSPGATSVSGGISNTSRVVSAAASTNATSAKASAGRVYAIQGYNAATSVRYLKIYNKASAPTVGTDTPIKTLALPPSAGFAFDFPVGYYFATGIAYALTTGSADSDTGALTAADVVGLNVDYQ